MTSAQKTFILVFVFGFSQISLAKGHKVLPKVQQSTPTPTAAQELNHAPTPILAETLSLKSAYRKAMDVNPALLQLRENVNQTATEVPLARSLVMPKITGLAQSEELKAAGSSGVAFGGNVIFNGDTYKQYSAGINLTQPLFQVGALAAIDSSKKDKQISQYNVEINERNTASNVISAYFQVALDMHNVDALLLQEKILRESLKTTEHRYQTGRSQLLDVLNVKTQLAGLASQIADAKNAVQIDAANLANLLGEPHAKAYAVKNNLHAPSLSRVDSDVDPGRFYIPELEQNKIQLSQIEDKKEVTLGQDLPSLSLFGDYDYQSFNKASLFDGINHSWDIGIKLTVPIFSGFSAFYNHDALVSQQLQLQFARKVIENSTNLAQVTGRKKLENANDDLIAGKETLDLAEQSSKEAIRQYRLATIDFINFLQIQTTYIQAQQILNQYKYNYIAALATYYSASGQDMAHLVDLLDEANK